jgi:hypothetical protein
LTSGVGSPEYSRSVLRAAYGLIESLDAEKKKKARTANLKIPAPEYYPQLVELVERIIQKPAVSIEVPRFLDFVCFEFLFKGKKIEENKIKEIFPIETSLIAKMGKNVAKFIMSNAGISEDIFKNLMDF